METANPPGQDTLVSRLHYQVTIVQQDNQDWRTMLSTPPEPGNMAAPRMPYPPTPIAEHLPPSIGLACCSRLPNSPKIWYTVPTQYCT